MKNKLKTIEFSGRKIKKKYVLHVLQRPDSHRNRSRTSRDEERRRNRRDRTKTDRVMPKNVLTHLISPKSEVGPEMTSSNDVTRRPTSVRTRRYKDRRAAIKTGFLRIFKVILYF